MTFSQLKADVYRRCGFSSSPASDVSTRIGAFVNEVQQDILSEPGMEFLLNDLVTFSSVASQQQYGLPIEVTKIKLLWDTTSMLVLAPMSTGEYRALYPNPASVTGTPRRYVDFGYDAVSVEPSDASTLYVLSSSASDTGTAYIEGIRSGGYPFTDSVVMTGVTAVASTYTDIISVTKFFLSTSAVGTVTLREDSGSGTTLATIPIGLAYSRYRRIALAPTPSAVISYSVECERLVTDMVQDTDEPVLPQQFHRLLAVGARAKEYEKQNQIQRWQVARGEFQEELKKLKFWIYNQTIGTPNMRGSSYKRDVLGDGGSIAVTSSSSTTPLAVTSGGTGFASYGIGDLLYADTATSLAKLSDVATGKVLKSGGIGVAPAYGQVVNADVSASAAIAYSKLNLATSIVNADVSASAAIAYSKLNLTGAIVLTTDVSGDLPLANLAQGTALSVLGVTGNATADEASIVAASDKQVLRRSGTAVAFGAIDISSSSAVSGVLVTANGGTSVDIASAALPLGSGQITFPATQNASSGANVLDDYEEGTWTPTDASGASLSLTLGTCTYIKIGKFVSVMATVTYPSTASGSVAKIGSLPFTADANQIGAGSVAFCDAATTPTQLLVRNNTTNIELFGGAGTGTTNTNMSTKSIIFEARYKATA